MSEKPQNSNWFMGLIVGALVVFVVANDGVFRISETEKGLVFLFEQVRDIHEAPGLKFKIPFVERVVRYDSRLQGHKLQSLEVTGGDQQKINISLYVRFRIEDPLLFYKTMTTVPFFIERLTSIAESTMREVIGNYSHTALLSEEREKLMNEIQNKVHQDSLGFGVDVKDVRIVEAELPVANQDAVFKRMRSDRQRIAKKLRAQGDEESRKIRSEADKTRKIIIAEAMRDSDILRGQGLSKAMAIYTDSIKSDPEFFEYSRSLEAYVESFQGDNTTFMLSPDAKFFKYFTGKQ
ncbi:protease modulator HflC [Alphaproteobacteria bacterium]|nr:protease modulator HflC [Alphaproteobacteria bacterium]